MNARQKKKHQTTPGAKLPKAHSLQGVFPVKLLVIVWAIGFMIYLNALQTPFNFDSIVFIKENPDAHNLFDVATLWRANPSRFLPALSFAVNYQIHGLNTLGYHLVNVVFHLGAASLVAILVHLLLSPALCSVSKLNYHRQAIALSAGLIFVCHPLQTQAVTYIWQRSTTMAAFFYLGGLILFIKARLANHSKQGLTLACASLIFTVSAMFCKEHAFTLPLCMAMVEFFFLREQKPWSLKAYAPFALCLLITPVMVFLSLALYKETLQVGSPDHVAPAAYLFTQIPVTLQYLRLLILPTGQNVDHHVALVTSIFSLRLIPGLLVLSALVWAGVKLFKNHRLLSFSIFWFFLALSVEAVSFILPDVMFEHRLYLPMFGFCLMVTTGLATVSRTSGFKMPLALMVLSFCGMTLKRNQVWQSEVALWRDSVAKSPEKCRPHLNLGMALYSENQWDEALKMLNKALEIKPDLPQGLTWRGLARQRLGQLELALADYDKAIDLGAETAPLFNNRGGIYLKMKKLDLALANFEEAIKKNPAYPLAFNNRGMVYQEKNLYDTAIEDFNKAIDLDPEFADAFFNRALSYEKKAMIDQAIADYQQCAVLNPKRKESLMNLGVLFHQKSETDKAYRYFDQAIVLDPGFTDAYLNRGSLAFNNGDYHTALKDFNKLMELNPTAEVLYRRGLANLYLKNKAAASQDLNMARDQGVAVPQQVWDLLNQ